MQPTEDPPELPEVGADDQDPFRVRPPTEIADEFDDDGDIPDDLVDEQITDGVRRRRGRKKKRATATLDGRPRGTSNSPGRVVTNEELSARSDSLDLWMSSFAWDSPGMYCTIKRNAPNYVNGIPVGGELAQKKNAGFSYDEVIGRWGGGEFRISVFGPRSESDSTVVPLNSKTFMIPGQPLLEEDALPEGTRDKMAQQGSPYMRGPRPPDPATRALDHAYAEVERMRDRPDPSDKITEMAQRSMDIVTAAAGERATAAVSAADERARMSIELMNREREERAKLDERMRDMEKQAMENDAKNRALLAEQIQGAQTSSMALLGALLPQMSNANSDNVKMIVAQYAAKESALMSQHQNDITNIDRLHQAQLQTLNNQFETQMRHIESLHKNNCTLLEAQIIALRAETEALKRQLEDARRDADKARNDLMTKVLSQKENDPLDQMSKMASIIELAKSFGGGGKEEGAGSGLEDNPLAQNLFRLADKALPVVGDFLAQRKAGQPNALGYAGPPPGYPPQLPPGYSYVPQQQMQQQQMQQQMPVQQPMTQPMRRPVPLPPRPSEPKLSRPDVQAAVDFVNGLLGQASPATPEETASTAISLLPNDTLKQLCRRTPEKLIVALKAEGMLIGPCATEQGQAYLIKLLHVLKQKFAERGDAMPPVQGG